MPKIGLLEDRPDQRVTIRRTIQANVKTPWEVIEVPLFTDPKRIPRWLVDNDVQVLVADYLLNEQSEDGAVTPVDYTSDKVIEHVREMMPDFPIYILTAVPDSSTAKPAPAEAEDVLQRREFTRNPSTYVKRMVRAGQRFSTQFQRELAELTVLSERIAQGSASSDDFDRARALQALIGLEITIDNTANRQQILEELEGKLSELEQLQGELQKNLKEQ